MASALFHRRAVLAGATTLGACASAAQSDQALTPYGSLDGVWLGDLDGVRGATVTPGRLTQVRLEISGSHARVFLFQDGVHAEIKAGTFHVSRLGTNAVIVSIETDPARPLHAGWIETWCFAVTLSEPNRLATNFTRVVNNNDLPPGTPSAHFSMMSAGYLERQNSDV